MTVQYAVRYLFWACALLIVAACDSGGQGPDRVILIYTPAQMQAGNIAQIAKGQELFKLNCSRCHGIGGEGDPQWRVPGADGKYLPPPLNGSGHAWHHSLQWLHNKIKQGSPPGPGTMPAWKDTLTDQEIDALIYWFQSLWPTQLYTVWYERGLQLE